MADLDACTVLKALDQAYFKLNISGTVRVAVDQNGERVEYSTADKVEMLKYMRALQPRCDTYQALALAAPKMTPVKFLF